jgi:hypothetical protein
MFSVGHGLEAVPTQAYSHYNPLILEQEIEP